VDYTWIFASLLALALFLLALLSKYGSDLIEFFHNVYT
jgi:hypothetical protein